jgi:hypothetical protein
LYGRRYLWRIKGQSVKNTGATGAFSPVPQRHRHAA